MCIIASEGLPSVIGLVVYISCFRLLKRRFHHFNILISPHTWDQRTPRRQTYVTMKKWVTMLKVRHIKWWSVNSDCLVYIFQLLSAPKNFLVIFQSYWVRHSHVGHNVYVSTDSIDLLDMFVTSRSCFCFIQRRQLCHDLLDSALWMLNGLLPWHRY